MRCGRHRVADRPRRLRAADASNELIPEAKSKTPEQIEAEKQRDAAYQESLRKIPDAKASSDPWGSVRSDTPKASASTKPPAKPRIKTGSNVK